MVTSIMDVTKTYGFILFGAMDVTKPHRSIGFGAMDVTKAYKFISLGAFTASYRSLASDRPYTGLGRDKAARGPNPGRHFVFVAFVFFVFTAAWPTTQRTPPFRRNPTFHDPRFPEIVDCLPLWPQLWNRPRAGWDLYLTVPEYFCNGSATVKSLK